MFIFFNAMEKNDVVKTVEYCAIEDSERAERGCGLVS
jgi:hypothetical protein